MDRFSFVHFVPSMAILLAALIPSVLAVTHDVQVGPNGQLVYDPPYVNAAAGDIINFIFNPKNHTVTQSTFDQPCMAVPSGTDSSFIPVMLDDPNPTFQVHVMDENPVWFFCRQTNHCGAGMVFAINPGPEGSATSFSAFQQHAIAINGTATGGVTMPTPTSAGTQTSALVDADLESYVTPPPPQWQTATATVTHGGSVYTTVYTSYDGTPPPSPAPEPVNHQILVGPDTSLTFAPASIQASVGDTVTFEFRTGNHTVAQSTFLQPCVRAMDGVSGEMVGFSSGFRPVFSVGSVDFPRYTITINDTAPIWGYCGQTGHCGNGMVFAINAVESGPNNFAAFQELARRINGTGSNSGSEVPAPSASGPGSSGDGGGNDDENAASVVNSMNLRELFGILGVTAIGWVL
ncbi:hypothetical protein AX16_008224 [Volvariella volvacea WC 439]|nr:hypothetical protein AX16_008224 [Volvariella volvacea WC 439]